MISEECLLCDPEACSVLLERHGPQQSAGLRGWHLRYEASVKLLISEHL